MSYNISGENVFIVKKTNEEVHFIEEPTGLLYYDTKNNTFDIVNTVK